MKLNTIIDKYNLCEDDDDKVEIILNDFDNLNDNSKWDFLIELLNYENTYDLVKIEIYKIIQLEDFNKKEIVNIKNGVLKALNAEKDELVKQWGLISLKFNYCNFSDVLELCVKTIENKNEDEDVKYNALSVLEKSQNTEFFEKFKNRLLNIKASKNIENSITEILKNKITTANNGYK